MKAKPLNILFSTTRQWNPGDEFILFGIINLLKELNLEFNPILYNRNPHIRPMFLYLNPLRFSSYLDIPYEGKDILEAFFRIGFWDNSYKDEMDLDFIDWVIFAGTPEWKTPRLIPLYEKLLEFNGKIMYIGIGSSGIRNYNQIDTLYKKVLQKATFISVRDEYTFNMLKPLSPLILPCPSLFASDEEKNISKIKHIGLVFSTSKSVPFNRIPPEIEKLLISLYNEIIKKNYWRTSIICHYIDEVPRAFKIFGDKVKIFYSYDAKDYIEIYKKFDLIITPRVHGSALATSLGIPSIVIPHDIRVNTALFFLAEIISLKNLNLREIKSLITNIEKNIKKINRNLIAYKKIFKQIYISHLSKKIFP